MTGTIKVPENCDRAECIKRFGRNAVAFYEARLRERMERGFTYLNPYKTIYLFASEDRRTCQGFYSTYVPRVGRARGHGRS